MTIYKICLFFLLKNFTLEKYNMIYKFINIQEVKQYFIQLEFQYIYIGRKDLPDPPSPEENNLLPRDVQHFITRD